MFIIHEVEFLTATVSPLHDVESDAQRDRVLDLIK